MDIRALKYFVKVADEKSFLRASEKLFTTQPNVSRTIKQLEEELNVQLFIRHGKGVSLSPAGISLLKRAKVIVELTDKAKAELASETIPQISIAAGETTAIGPLGTALKQLRKQYPQALLHIYSGNEEEVCTRIDDRTSDLGIIFDSKRLHSYDYYRLPRLEKWALVMRNDAPLAKEKFITPEMIKGLPLILSRTLLTVNMLPGWLGYGIDQLNIAATFNLATTPKFIIPTTDYYMLTFGDIVVGPEEKNLTAVPLKPPLESPMFLIWSKELIFNKPLKLFLDCLVKTFQEQAKETQEKPFSLG